jgi:hypothetical protein
MPPEPELEDLLERARQGDGAAINQLFGSHRPQLRRMVELRLDGCAAGSTPRT